MKISVIFLSIAVILEALMAPTVEAAPEPAKQTPTPTPASSDRPAVDIDRPRVDLWSGQNLQFKNPFPKYTSAWHIVMSPGFVGLDWLFATERREWLSVAVRDGDQFKKDGYNPSYTHIVSDYKPVVHKLPDGRWEIVFKDIK
jgi:hypothetical protein